MSDFILFNASLKGDANSFKKLLSSGIDYLNHYFFIQYEDKEKAELITVEVIKKAFAELNTFNNNHTFLEWISNFNSTDDSVFLKNYQKAFPTSEESSVDSAKIKLLPSMYSFDLFLEKSNDNVSDEEIRDSIDSLNSSGEDSVVRLNLDSHLKNKYKFPGIIIFVTLCLALLSFAVYHSDWANSYLYSNNKVIDEAKLKKLEMPIEDIFYHYLINNIGDAQRVGTQTIHDISDNDKDVEEEQSPIQENISGKNTTIAVDTILVKKKIEPKASDEIKIIKEVIIEPKLILIDEPINKKEDFTPSNTVDKDVKEGPVKTQEIKKVKPKEAQKIKDEKIEDKEEKKKPPHVVNKEWVDAILLGDGGEHELKEYRDKHVVLFVGLAVKDLEKAKKKVIKILEKNNYATQTLHSSDKEIQMRASFPGKKNHDRMIKKIARVGSLYGGNDIAEFFDLYKKKKMSDDGRRLIQKFKPEDLPKKVTVVLLIVPKKKKGSK